MQRAMTMLGLMLTLSCGKEDAKGNAASATSTSSLATTASPAASPVPTVVPPIPSAPASADVPLLPKCPAGFKGNAFPAYCIKVPLSYAVKQARTSPKRGSIEYDTGTTTDNLMISYDESPIGQVSKDVESEMKFGGDKLEKKGDLPGGNKWFQGAHAEYARIVTLFKGPGPLTLKCSFAYQAKKAPSKDAIDACKSIVVP